MKHLGWHLRDGLRAVGLPGWVAAGLVLVCAGVWWGSASPLAAVTAGRQADNAALERRLKEGGPVQPARVMSPQQQLAEFERRFGDAKSATAALGRLHAIARRQGVSLDQAELKLSRDAREPLVRYAIVLPIKADYLALRRFIAEALRELPGLAMEEMNLRRADARTPQVEAQLRLVLFLNPAKAD